MSRKTPFLLLSIFLLSGCSINEMKEDKWDFINSQKNIKELPTQPAEEDKDTAEEEWVISDEAAAGDGLIQGELDEDLADLEKLEQEVNQTIQEIEEIERNLAELDALTKELDELEQIEQDLAELEELLGE